MEIVIGLVGIAIPVAALLFLFGYLKGLDDASDVLNWGAGFDAGWDAYKEFVIDTRRADNGLDKPESGD